MDSQKGIQNPRDLLDLLELDMNIYDSIASLAKCEYHCK